MGAMTAEEEESSDVAEARLAASEFGGSRFGGVGFGVAGVADTETSGLAFGISKVAKVDPCNTGEAPPSRVPAG
jgi:hypothetical protein